MPDLRAIPILVATTLALIGGASATELKTEPGSFPVKTAELRLAGEDDSWSLDLVVRYPEGEGKFPLVLFSHGFGSDNSAFAPVSEFWASHGFVVVHPSHVSQRGAGGGILSMRTKEMSRILDELDRIEVEIPALAAKIDRTRMAAAGHSLGAATAMLLAGTATRDGDALKSFRDDRIDCSVMFSAAGTGEYGLVEESWAPMKGAALFVTGTRDLRPGYEFEWRREPYEFASAESGKKYLLVLDGATHFHFGGGLAGRREGLLSGRFDHYTSVVKAVSTAFFDLHLKQAEATEEDASLNPATVKKFSDAVASFEAK